MGWNVEEVVHEAGEFGSLDWSSLDAGRFGQDWSMGRGGYGLRDDQWRVRVPRDGRGDVWDVWCVPDSLSAAINQVADLARRDGGDGVRGPIIKALGLGA